MYKFYLDNMLLPVTPSKLTVKINGTNKTLTMINEGEINFLRTPGLTDVSFDCVLPGLAAYAFSADSYSRPDNYLGKFESLMTSKKPFQFIVKRGSKLFKTNMKVSLESYSIKEDASKGPDLTISLELKQYRDFATKTVTLPPITRPAASATVQQNRETSNAPSAQTYTVKKGDTLWAIAKKYYGSGAQYPKIVAANSSIKNPNLIYPGQVFTIP